MGRYSQDDIDDARAAAREELEEELEELDGDEQALWDKHNDWRDHI